MSDNGNEDLGSSKEIHERKGSGDRRAGVSDLYADPSDNSVLRNFSLRDIRPEWREQFSREAYILSIERCRNVFLFGLLINLLSFFVYDYPMYMNGSWGATSMYRHILEWRISVCAMMMLYLLAYQFLQHEARVWIRAIQATSGIVIAGVLGTWLSIVSQVLVPDISIFALSMFAIAGLCPFPTYAKYVYYPLFLGALLLGILAFGINSALKAGNALNAVCVSVVAAYVDLMCLRSYVRNFIFGQILSEERSRSDLLLRNMLPNSVAERLKQSSGHIVEFHGDVTVLFADVVGFTALTTKLSPIALIELLETLFMAFDDLAEKFGVEKIKTIGDAYMAASGVPLSTKDHTERVARMGLAMLDACKKFSVDSDLPLDLRVGIHTGSAIAGVIGRKKFVYDLWGDTVNIASRMESHGVAGRIHVTEQVQYALRRKFLFESRGQVELKGKGPRASYFLVAEKQEA